MMTDTTDTTERFLWFIEERYRIFERKTVGLPKPWTDDPILQNYRFCNVYREHDTETKWLVKNWRTPHKSDPDFWFAALVFRLINWHETAEELNYPVPWDPIKFKGVLQSRMARGLKVYGGAYCITTHGVRQSKVCYLADTLTRIWNQREELRPQKQDGLYYMHSRLLGCHDIGSFMSGQVIADAKYTPALDKVADWWTFAVSGQGSKRGLNRILGRDKEEQWKEPEWKHNIDKIRERHIKSLVVKANMPLMHAQDVQNCLCEFDKYERVRLGEGRPKQRYDGGV